MQKRLKDDMFSCRYRSFDEKIKIFPDYWIQGFAELYVGLQYHECLEIGVCLQSSGMFFIKNRYFPFSVGNIAVVLPGDIHYAQSPDENKSVWFYLFFDPADFDIDNAFRESTILRDEHSFTVIKTIMNEFAKKEPGYEKRIPHLLKYFFERREAITEHSDLFLLEDTNLDLLPAIECISKDFTREIPVCKLASVCGFSEDHFRKTFKKATGLLPHQYINEIRMTTAEQLLTSTEKPVLEIAYEVGFSSISSFNRVFKDKNGTSPRDFRKQNKKN